MTELKQLIEQLETLKADYEKIKTIKNELHNNIFDIEEKICQYATENKIDKIKLDGKEIEAKFNRKIDILGGTTKNPEYKTEIVKELVETGLLDESKVRYFEGVAVNTNSLLASIKKLDDGTLLRMKADNKISINFLPSVKIR